MFDKLVDGFAEVTGCDRAALAALVEQTAASGPVNRLGRVAAAERLAAAVQAVQLQDLAAVNQVELAEGDATAWGGDRDPELAHASRVVAVEVAKACRVSVRTAGARIEAAIRGHDGACPSRTKTRSGPWTANPASTAAVRAVPRS